MRTIQSVQYSNGSAEIKPLNRHERPPPPQLPSFRRPSCWTFSSWPGSFPASPVFRAFPARPMGPLAAVAAAAEQVHRRTVVERLLGPVPDRTANADDGHRLRHHHRDRGDRSVPCGHRDGADPACTGQVVAVERTADGTDSGRTGRSFADGLRTRWGDSRDVVGRRADIRGSRNGAMACPGGAACAVACDGRVEAADVPAVDGAAVERSRSGEDRGHRGHRVAAAVGLVADRPMLGLVLRPRMGWKLE